MSDNRKKYNVSIPNVLSEATIVGRVVKDADFRATASQNVTNLRLAISRSYLPTGETQWKEETAFVNFAVWGDNAERIRNIKASDIMVIRFSISDLLARPYKSQDKDMASLDVKRAQMWRFAWTENGNSQASEAIQMPEPLEGIEY